MIAVLNRTATLRMLRYHEAFDSDVPYSSARYRRTNSATETATRVACGVGGPCRAGVTVRTTGVAGGCAQAGFGAGPLG